jgi:hypothetical protein
MPLNLGYIELGGGDLVIRIYYDETFSPVGPDQPLVNRSRGYCLDIKNTGQRPMKVTVTGLTGNPFSVNLGTGDPVTTGPSRSRTAAQLATLGFSTRGDVGTVSLEN